jgi:hypothetical protein
MKRKFLSALFFVCAFSFVAFAQSVVITQKKITYRRPKPFTEYKKSFVIVRPKIKGVSLSIAKKIETTISYEKNFDFNVKDEISEIQWLEKASYAVDYNKNGILGVTISVMGSGAYPSEASRPIIANLETGDKVLAKDVFVKLSELAAKGKQTQEAEIKRAIVEIKKEDPEEENPAALFENTDFTVENLDKFSVSDKGITFWYDYGFPHVIMALQPEGRYFFSWTELKTFIKPDGLLAQFNR